MKQTIASLLRIVLVLAAPAALVSGAAQSFDFKDPKGVNNVQFQLDAPLESISGTATGISGTVSYDPEAPEETSGHIVLEANSLTVGNPVMAEHLLGKNWMNVEEHPTIRFELASLENVRQDGNTVKADARGELTIKGNTREITVPVTLTHLPNKLGARLNDDSIEGDLLVLRSNFKVDRHEFGIQPGQNTDKVASEIDLSLSIAGAARRD